MEKGIGKLRPNLHRKYSINDKKDFRCIIRPNGCALAGFKLSGSLTGTFPLLVEHTEKKKYSHGVF